MSWGSGGSTRIRSPKSKSGNAFGPWRGASPRGLASRARGIFSRVTLTGLLGAVRALGVHRLDDEGLDLGRVQERRRLVLEHARPLVPALAVRLLLHQRLAQAHVDAALDLPDHQQRVDRPAHVVRD